MQKQSGSPFHPYIRSEDIYELEPEVKNYDPIIALDGGFDGLDVYRNICGAIKEKRKKKIAVLFEIGYDQASEVSSIMKNNNCPTFGHSKLSNVAKLAKI